MDSPYKIAVLGLWHLGEVYSAGLAELGHNVIGISDDEVLIANFKKNIPPLAEPRLEELLTKHQASGALAYATDSARLEECNVLWLAYDTPVDDEDVVDTGIIFENLKKAVPHLNAGALIVASSQLPVGTSKKICDTVKTLRPELSFEYAYTPENLRLGDAVKCFMEPGRIVVGVDSASALIKMKEIFSPLNAEIVSMSVPSAEMTKHAMNAWLATSISFTNDLADVCERVGADIEDVIKALKAEPRVGPKAYLFAGLGFSGGTLGRDLKALMGEAKELGISLPVIESVYVKNKSRNDVVAARLKKEIGDIKGKTLVLFGVTYKAGTSTLRRSQPLEIERELRESGAMIKLYDPLAKSDEVKVITPSAFFRDAYEAAAESDVLLIMTPSRDYQNLDFKKLASVMKTPTIFDTCNILCSVEPAIREAGINYISIGR